MEVCDQEICLPATDEHFKQFSWYQHNVYKLAKKHVQHFRTAIDVGAHVGYFSIYMAQDFANVIAFEPVPSNTHCWRKNLSAKTNVKLFECALGDTITPLCISQPHKINSGSWEISRSGYPVEQNRLDSFGLSNVDYIKLDIQGYELNALLGALNTINQNKPIVQIEMSSKDCIQRAGSLMSKLGYAPVEQLKDDVIWKFVDEFNKRYIISLIGEVSNA